jgi:hypothetical protein
MASSLSVIRTSAPNICRSTPCSTPDVEKSGWMVTGLTQYMLMLPPVAPVDAAGDAAATGDAAPAAGDAAAAGEAALAAAVGALAAVVGALVGAAAADVGAAVVAAGFGALVAVGAVDPPHAASSAPAAAALAEARNRRRVHMTCRSLVAIGNPLPTLT